MEKDKYWQKVLPIDGPKTVNAALDVDDGDDLQLFLKKPCNAVVTSFQPGHWGDRQVVTVLAGLVFDQIVNAFDNHLIEFCSPSIQQTWSVIAILDFWNQHHLSAPMAMNWNNGSSQALQAMAINWD